MRTLKIFFHDNCFDGTASAALFEDFYRRHIDGKAKVVYEGVQHVNGDPFAGLAIDADDNACVDFRYCQSPRMTWWFDHHVSAFQPPEIRAHFNADQSGQKFYDPTATSCSKFLVEVLGDHFGYELPPHMRELVEWADIIDTARFGSAKAAVELDVPATKLMTWIRHMREPELMHRYISALRSMSMAELVSQPWLESFLSPLLDRHRRIIDITQKRAVDDGVVVFVDLSEDPIDVYNSFITYFLFPKSKYTVGMVRDGHTVRITVGHNPWSAQPRTHNIAAICEKFGGGGHPFVGGVSLPNTDNKTGRRAARTICEMLGK